MTNTVVDVVTLKPMPGVSDADYLAAPQKTAEFVGFLPGSIHRRLTKGDDGVWRDCAISADRSAAQEAGAKFPQADCPADLIRMIDPATLVLRHEQHLWDANPAMAMGSHRAMGSAMATGWA